MSIKDTDAPVDVAALAETFSGPGPYPWTAARDVRLLCAEAERLRKALNYACEALDTEGLDETARRLRCEGGIR